MARTPSTMRQLGSELPRFELPDTKTGQLFSSAALGGEVAVVAFICNHCPFVIHLKAALAAFGRDCEAQGARMVAISSNDVSTHPADGPALMTEDAKTFGYPFPYLYDESQAVARAFDAACTPDFFVFDREGKLAYRGQFDDSRPGNGKAVNGADLRAAVSALLSGAQPSPEQKPSIGCNIKWKG
jgi:peroxiredoxin